MKSMTLTTCGTSIPRSILELAAEINNKLGDQNFTVAIRDEDTGREYLIEPHERRMSHDAERGNRSRRTLYARHA